MLLEAGLLHGNQQAIVGIEALGNDVHISLCRDSAALTPQLNHGANRLAGVGRASAFAQPATVYPRPAYSSQASELPRGRISVDAACKK